MNRKEYKTQIALILSLTLLWLLLSGLAEAGTLGAKAGAEKEAVIEGSFRQVNKDTANSLLEGNRAVQTNNVLPGEKEIVSESPLALRLYQGPQPPIGAIITASRTAGVAPLAVFFDGSQSTGLMDDDYVNAQFTWNFDSTDTDPVGQDEMATGFLAAYVFTEPGAYTVTMNVMDKDGNTGEASIEIDVLPFSGTTYYVAANGDDSNPGTIDEPLQTVDFALRQKAVANTRILFRNGDTFNLEDVAISDRGGPVIIGSYTDPAHPSNEKPILNSSSTDTSGVIGLHVDDWRLTDIHIIGYPYYNWGILAGGSSSNILLFEVEIETTSTAAQFYGDGFFVFNSLLHNLGRTGLYGTANKFAFVNNRIIEHSVVTDGSHGIRIASGQKTVIRNNLITASSAHTSITIRGKGGGTNTDLVVSGNVLDHHLGTGGSGSPGWESEHVHHALFEKNLLIDYGSVGFGITTDHITVRNNLFNTHRAVGVDLRRNFLSFDSIYIYNNTHYNIDVPEHDTIFFAAGVPTDGGASMTNFVIKNNIMYTNCRTWAPFIYFNEPAQELEADNNLFYAPDHSPSWKPFHLDGQSYTLAEWQAIGKGLNTLNVDPIFTSTDIGDPDYLYLGVESPAIDAGASVPGLFEDFAGTSRPQDGPDPDTIPQWDIGAYEYALLTLPGDFDEDGDVDMDDYAMFEEAYTGANRPVAPGYEYADLDGDGDVDLDDFAIFAANYTG